LLLHKLPPARERIADHGCDSRRFRAALAERGIIACMPPEKSRRQLQKSRKQPIACHKAQYRQRHRIENSFGRLKDWRRIAARYNNFPTIFLGAIFLTATVISWLRPFVLFLILIFGQYVRYG
jgi:transposase